LAVPNSWPKAESEVLESFIPITGQKKKKSKIPSVFPKIVSKINEKGKMWSYLIGREFLSGMMQGKFQKEAVMIVHHYEST
jgi:hypothetical protein